MDVSEAIQKRRSIRSFDTSKQLTEEQINKILEAGRLAPSAHNLQDWYFVVVRDKNLKEKMVEAAAGQSFIGEASIIIVICADLRLAERHSARHGEDFYMIQDTAIAATHMILEITELGLGTCWIGAFDEGEVKKVLGLEDHFRPIALLPVGYPAESPSPKPRKNLEEISRKI